MASLGNRIVALIDMDCFFCQVEARLNPELAGKPLAVVQYNQWKSGGIIAVNYEARDFGVTRHMRGDEAKEKCPGILLASVPCLRGKADTSRYRSAGREVIEVLKKNCSIVERASVDEAYLDLTQMVDDKLSKELFDSEDVLLNLKNTFVVGHSESGINDEEQRSKGIETWLSESSEDIQIQRLSIAGVIVENVRKDIYETTGFRCSAGISFNKILAKLACGLHKPNRQTILPASTVPELFGTLPVKKVRNLGGKLGDIVTDSLKCNVMGDLLPYSLQFLQNRFDDKTGMWLYNIARGIDSEPVTPRLVSKSIGACKIFPGKQALVDVDSIKHWLGELSAEVCERLEQDLEENERRASLLTVSFRFYQNKTSVSQSKSSALTSYKPEKIAEQSFNIVAKATQQLPISFLGLSAGKFNKAKGSENFMNFFKPSAVDSCASPSSSSTNINTDKATEISKLTEESAKFDDDVNDVRVKEEFDDNVHDVGVKEEIETHTVEKVKTEKNLKPSSSAGKARRRSSPCSSIQKSLKPDNFKKSFFMNILKQKQLNYEDSETEMEEDLVETNEEDANSHDNDTEDIAQNNTEHVSTDNAESPDKICSSASNNDVAVELQEIFPDLNDIDPNIVRLLPLHLQQEAKKFLKTPEPPINKTGDSGKAKNKTASKRSKEKVTKCKTTSQKPARIQNFFIKTDANSGSDKFKKCSQCDQLIVVDKFDEHSDYHVAQSLQTQMNRRSSNDETRKRKVITDGPNQLKNKRLSDETISPFFQQ